MKIGSYRDIRNVSNFEDFIRLSSQFFDDVASLLDGGIQFDSNIETDTIPVFFATANVDVQVRHNLNKSNINYLIVQKPVTVDVYHGSGTDTNSVVYLRSTVGGITLTMRLD